MLVNGQNDVEPVNGKVNEFSENIRTVQEILRQHHDDVELQVTEIMCGPGSKAGDNYMSKIKRIGVKIKTNNNSGECQAMTRGTVHVKLKLSFIIGGEGQRVVRCATSGL